MTGGNRGIGRAVAQSLSDNGMLVGILGRDERALQRAARELQGPWARADVGRRAELEPALAQLYASLGRLDVIVCCAGFSEHVSIGNDPDEAEAAWDRVIETDLKGAFLCSRWAAERLPRPGGRIICISSIAAYTGGSAGGALAYGAAKAGVLGLVRALARELAPAGIAANAIAPGLVDGTDFFGPGDQTERVERTVAQIPAGRPGAPDDVAAAAAFLSSLGADYINGQVLHVNGGWYLGG